MRYAYYTDFRTENSHISCTKRNHFFFFYNGVTCNEMYVLPLRNVCTQLSLCFNYLFISVFFGFSFSEHLILISLYSNT